jgi:PIN domain nuclease of toxin-antitoxin system
MRVKRLLLDTHVLLWWLAHDPALGPESYAVIRDAYNDVYISAATTWEASIKKALGKLEAPDDLDRIVEAERFLKLSISLYHGQMAGRLPAYHRDPFDRMLVAQAQAEGLTIVTADRNIPRYGVQTLPAYD